MCNAGKAIIWSAPDYSTRSKERKKAISSESPETDSLTF